MNKESPYIKQGEVMFIGYIDQQESKNYKPDDQKNSIEKGRKAQNLDIPKSEIDDR